MGNKQLSGDGGEAMQSDVRRAMNPLRKRSKQIPVLFIFLGFLLLAGIYRIYF